MTATRNPPVLSDDLGEACALAVRDLAICLRGYTPNADLRDTDGFLVVGEWKFAQDEMISCINDGRVTLGAWGRQSLGRLEAIEKRMLQSKGDRTE